ncbi:sugar ABC transporter permease [Mesorhizobium sp. Cs1299R1N1]|uniref:carbohydrate ABC transporter permease n=1 Tax=Mesorhizobium sp. Cs1299R1N1 TaxID=3015172 RepID=UPI00301C17F0
MTAMALPSRRVVHAGTDRSQAIQGWVLAMPAAMLLAVLVIAPLLIVFGMSFTDYSLAASHWAFIGLDNYTEIFRDRRAFGAVLHTAAYIAITVPLSVGLGLVLALLIQQRRTLRNVYEVVFFLPATSTFIAMAIVWQFLLHGRIGPINDWLVALGLGRVDFLTDPTTALATLAVIGAWQLVGQTTILTLAGLASVPTDIYEAAELDGMTRGWDRFLRVTMPMLAPTLLFVTVTTTITAFQVFDSVAALTQGGPAGSTETLLYKIYLEAYQYTNMGYAAALSVLFLVFIVVFSMIQILFADKRIHY